MSLDLAALLLGDPWRFPALDAVAALGLTDGWLAAGFVREAVWEHLHGRPPTPPSGDVDVIWFDMAAAAPAVEQALEARLAAAIPGLRWEVRNQARMHLGNGDPPYRDATDAMRHWPETATAAGVRLRPDGGLDFAAPYGLDDLMGLVLRPTPAFAGAKQAIYRRRVAEKLWRERWPRLREAAAVGG